MLKWLMAVDGSPSSLRAIDVAAKWARAGVPIEVVLIHVGDTPRAVEGMMPSDIPVVRDAVERAQHHLLADAESRALGGGLRVSGTLAAVGAPAAQIVRAAREHGADQIAMGLHGLGALHEAEPVPGGVALHVLGVAELPVLLVP